MRPNEHSPGSRVGDGAARRRPLPPGWQKLRIADDAPEHGGHVYYLNETTMETRWTPPEMDDDTVDAWTAKRSPENAKRGHLAFGSSKPPPRKLIFRHKLADVDLQLDVPPGIKAKLLSEEEGQEHAGNDTDAELQQDGTSAEAEPLLLIVSVTKDGQLHEVPVDVEARANFPAEVQHLS